MLLPEIEISILLPAYNEALRIAKCLEEVEQAVRCLSDSYEVIVAEDGSTDGTDSIIADLSRNNPHVRFLHSPIRLGKGKAVKRALNHARGKVIVFMDVDLATNLNGLPRIIKLAREHNGLAIGSRHVQGSRVSRPASRTLFSLSYNLFVRLLFLDGVHDHQCGFKAMSREVADTLRKCAKSNGLFLDTEMILLCKRMGFPVMEVGVDWSEPKKTSEFEINLLRDSTRMGLDALKHKLKPNEPQDY
jgi:glycosyltransferase involved in cell wall biosynthesis